MTGLTIRPARTEDVRAIKALLRSYGLPRSDLGRYIEHFLVAADERGELAGSAGLEVYSRSAVLRSVAVASSLRGRGLGSRLTQAALDLAARLGVRRVYLFTADAGPFFARFGFRPIHPDEVDPAIAGSREYLLVRRWWPKTDVTVMGLDLPEAPPFVGASVASCGYDRGLRDVAIP